MRRVGSARGKEERVLAAEGSKLRVVLEAVGARRDPAGDRRLPMSNPVGRRRLESERTEGFARLRADEYVAGDIASSLGALHTGRCTGGLGHGAGEVAG